MTSNTSDRSNAPAIARRVTPAAAAAERPRLSESPGRRGRRELPRGGRGRRELPRRRRRRDHPRVVLRVVVRVHRPQLRQRHVRVGLLRRRKRRGRVRAVARAREIRVRVPRGGRERVPHRVGLPARGIPPVSPPGRHPRRFRREELEDPRLCRRDAIGGADDDAHLAPPFPRVPLAPSNRDLRAGGIPDFPYGRPPRPDDHPRLVRTRHVFRHRTLAPAGTSAPAPFDPYPSSSPGA